MAISTSPFRPPVDITTFCSRKPTFTISPHHPLTFRSREVNSFSHSFHALSAHANSQNEHQEVRDMEFGVESH